MNVRTAHSAHRARSSGMGRGPGQGPCHRAFVQGQEDRKVHPLTMGLYKLQELRRALDRDAATAGAIAAAVSGKGGGRGKWPSDSNCTTTEKGSWLKKLPQSLARDLGYIVVPAVSALHGDDIGQSDVTRLVAEARRATTAIVALCDDMATAIRASVDYEYAAMRCGHSMAIQIIDQMEALVTWLIDEVNEISVRYATQSSPNHHRDLR